MIALSCCGKQSCDTSSPVIGKTDSRMLVVSQQQQSSRNDANYSSLIYCLNLGSRGKFILFSHFIGRRRSISLFRHQHDASILDLIFSRVLNPVTRSSQNLRGGYVVCYLKIQQPCSCRHQGDCSNKSRQLPACLPLSVHFPSLISPGLLICKVSYARVVQDASLPKGL